MIRFPISYDNREINCSVSRSGSLWSASCGGSKAKADSPQDAASLAILAALERLGFDPYDDASIFIGPADGNNLVVTPTPGDSEGEWAVDAFDDADDRDVVGYVTSFATCEEAVTYAVHGLWMLYGWEE